MNKNNPGSNKINNIMEVQTEKPIIIFDALDTIQGYKGAPAGQSKRFYQDHIARQAGFKNTDEFLTKVPYDVQLWMNYFELQKGNLEPIIIPGAELMMALYPKSRFDKYIVTADIPEAALLTCKPFIDNDDIQPQNIIAMNHLGNKKKPTTWKKVHEEYFPKQKVEVVFEDSIDNLFAAGKAYGLKENALCHIQRGKEPVTLDTHVAGDIYSLAINLMEFMGY